MEMNPYETIVDLEDSEFQNLQIAQFYVEYLEQGEDNALLFEIDELTGLTIVELLFVLENDFYKMNLFVSKHDASSLLIFFNSYNYENKYVGFSTKSGDRQVEM